MAVQSPFVMIKRLIDNEYNNDPYFSKIVYDSLCFANSDIKRTRVICMFWSMEWIVDSMFAPVINALKIMSKVYFSIFALPLNNLKEPLRNYIRSVIFLLRSGLIKYGCKNPPQDEVECIICPLSEDELIEYAVCIIESNPDATIYKDYYLN